MHQFTFTCSVLFYPSTILKVIHMYIFYASIIFVSSMLKPSQKQKLNLPIWANYFECCKSCESPTVSWRTPVRVAEQYNCVLDPRLLDTERLTSDCVPAKTTTFLAGLISMVLCCVKVVSSVCGKSIRKGLHFSFTIEKVMPVTLAGIRMLTVKSCT